MHAMQQCSGQHSVTGGCASDAETADSCALIQQYTKPLGYRRSCLLPFTV